jgi:acetyltransferase
VKVGATTEIEGTDWLALFNPRGVAIVGASANLSRIGGQPVRALLEAGYAGRVYPVNPKYDEIAGHRCYRSVSEIDGPCDLAVIAVPANAAPDAIVACGRAGVRFAVVLSGGFREIGGEGTTLEARLLAAARESGIRLIGPNCQGLISMASRVFAVFGAISHETHMQPGAISMVFQSGGFGFAVMTLCDALGIRFRHCVSIGNEADITTPELIDAFVADPGTQVIFLYIEGVRDGRALIASARKALSAGKPVVVWKGGKTEVGKRAAASHTANMTGRYDLYRAAFRQAGIIEVQSVDEIADIFNALSGRRLPVGGNLASLAISGGAGIVFADAATAHGACLPAFSAQTSEKLQAVLPAFASTANPVDITADIFNDISKFIAALDVVLADPNVDQLAILLASLPGRLALEAANAIVAAQARSTKPVLIGWSARKDRAPEAYQALEAAHIPILSSPERVGFAAATLSRYAGTARNKAPSLIEPERADEGGSMPSHCQRETLNEEESKRLLQKFGIPVSDDVVVRTDDDSSNDYSGLSFPVVAKVLSADIPHKSDVGGVKVGLGTPAALRTGLREMMASVSRQMPQARIEGALVSSMVTDGVEAIVGVINDPTFGPVVALGIGGIFTEILHDITYRIAPFNQGEARAMVSELRAGKLLEGARGTPPRDVEALVDTLVRVARMAWELRDSLVELDINPLFIRPAGEGVVAADCLATFNDRRTALRAALGERKTSKPSVPCEARTRSRAQAPP